MLISRTRCSSVAAPSWSQPLTLQRQEDRLEHAWRRCNGGTGVREEGVRTTGKNVAKAARTAAGAMPGAPRWRRTSTCYDRASRRFCTKDGRNEVTRLRDVLAVIQDSGDDRGINLMKKWVGRLTNRHPTHNPRVSIADALYSQRCLTARTTIFSWRWLIVHACVGQERVREVLRIGQRPEWCQSGRQQRR